jgi:hypothetical protein
MRKIFKKIFKLGALAGLSLAAVIFLLVKLPLFLGAISLLAILLFDVFMVYKILLEPPSDKTIHFDSKVIEAPSKYIKIIDDYTQEHGRLFRDKLLAIIEDTKKFIKKKERLDKSLLNHFEKTELSYIKFSTILRNIENSVSASLNNILIRLSSFDADEYEVFLRNAPLTQASYIERTEIYNDHLKYITSSVTFINDIVLKMDKLQYETAKIQYIDSTKIDEIEAIQDITHLIDTMKYYKN